MTCCMGGLHAKPLNLRIFWLGYTTIIFFMISTMATAQDLLPSQVIPLRSGSTMPDEYDTHVVGMQNKFHSSGVLATSQALTSHANELAAVPAVIESNPTARWIKPFSDSATIESLAGYAIPFTVNSGTIASADLQYTAAFAGELTNGVTGSLKLNGIYIGNVAPVTSGTLNSQITIGELAPLLQEGTNWLEISDLPMESQSRLVLSARVNIWHTSDIPVQLVNAKTEVVSEESNYLMGTLDACQGFTCRPRGDLNSDFVIDLSDYFWMVDCFSGVGVAAAEYCENADMDCDGDVDLVDMANFDTAFTGNP